MSLRRLFAALQRHGCKCRLPAETFPPDDAPARRDRSRPRYQRLPAAPPRRRGPPRSSYRPAALVGCHRCPRRHAAGPVASGIRGLSLESSACLVRSRVLTSSAYAKTGSAMWLDDIKEARAPTAQVISVRVEDGSDVLSLRRAKRYPRIFRPWHQQSGAVHGHSTRSPAQSSSLAPSHPFPSGIRLGNTASCRHCSDLLPWWATTSKPPPL